MFCAEGVAFVIADVCSLKQLKGNFAGSGCLMDLCKQTKCELAGSKEAFGLQKSTRKAMSLLVGEERGRALCLLTMPHRNPKTAQLQAQTDEVTYQ